MSEPQVPAYRLSLNDEGRIFRQKDRSNPLPGEAIGSIAKGESILVPVVVVDAAGAPAVEDVQGWLAGHIGQVLEPLMALRNTEGLPEPVQKICERLYTALGILPREELEDQIALLDPDMRKVLRSKKIRLGPVLVFLPDLNKPAAVRMRALLWGLYHGKPLPMKVPADGIVSLKVEDGADKLFYRTIGYPVYGPRAVRIDMLDRVIVSVYDGANGGKFQARHEMAEWLGSSIEDLYRVLEAMGHKKIYDPADEKKEEVTAEAGAGEAEKPAAEKPQVKPELATFRLKKGKASESAPQKPERKEAPRQKPQRKKEHKKPRKKEDRGPRVISAAAKSDPAESPFAILEQLKSKSGES